MTNKLLTAVAPMEGLTTRVFRRIHSEMFGGADSYYIPFVSPTMEPGFTPRQMKELNPETNKGINAIPQLLTARSADFIWAARELAGLGYKEVNFNLGCPAGTVTAKGKGSGFLRNLPQLEKFLNQIFEAALPIQISLKTRIGFNEASEADAIMEVLAKFPFSMVIIHPRLKVDQYRSPIREEVFQEILPRFSQPLGFNGDIATWQDIEKKAIQYPELKLVMSGRGLVSDPALFRKYKGGLPVEKEELQEFTQKLMAGYAEAFESQKNALMRMKEHWFYLLNLFDPSPSLFKKLFRAKEVGQFENCLDEIFNVCPFREDAREGWKKVVNPN